MQSEITYSSKKDWWLMAIIAGAGLALAWAAANQVTTNSLTHPASWILLLCLLFYLAVVLIFAYPVSYEIRPPDLLIRAGLTNSRITLSSIEAIRPARDPSSAPALSLDRLRIDYMKKGKPAFTLVSPEDKTNFLTNLVQAAGGLELRGNQVIRPSTSKDAQQVTQPDI
ncbi:MAG: PH domain-containing protein [Deltaproteobacteria bacterium]|nr:PH domain-containing protein [Deltaproteobacteria bacterium]MBT8373398.1 PH domain-containing protein [Deltaproteobacteria bacterium]